MPQACRAAIVLALLAATAGVQASDTVTILRDRWGVPHIFTSGRDAGDRAAYANGYAQAEDRLFEMDVLRRAGTGRLAEMLGSGYLLMDEVVRRDGFTAAERGHFLRRLAGRDRRALEAYRDGVNAFIARVTAEPRRLPVEFGGTAPAPWTTDDSVAVAILELLSFNFHYADDAGNIAYFHRGALPRRPPATDPRLPLDGRGTMEWRGIDPPRKLPAVVNPQRGFIANWNNKPVPGWSAGEQRELWGVADRVQGLSDALEAARARGATLSVNDVQGLMRHAALCDVFAVLIVPFLEDAVATAASAPGDAPLREAVARVRSWVDAGASLAAVPDGHGVVPDPGAAIYTAFRAAAQSAIFADELGDATHTMYFPDVLVGDQEDDHGSFGTADALFLRVLLSAGAVAGAQVPAGTLPVSRDYFTDVRTGTSRTRAEVLTGALRSALDRLATRFGTTDQSTWQLTALRETYRDLGLISGVFGSTEMQRENRGSFNLVLDLGAPVRGEIILPPGESGSFTADDIGHEPPHLRDQLPVYEAFDYRRQPFTADELEPPVTSESVRIVRAGRTGASRRARR